MIRIGKEKGILRVVADQTMSPTSTKDIADAILGMLRKTWRPELERRKFRSGKLVRVCKTDYCARQHQSLCGSNPLE